MDQTQSRQEEKIKTVGDDSNFISQWKIFIKVFGSPIILILIIASALLIYWSSKLESEQLATGGNIHVIRAFLFIIISLLSGLAGVLISKQWSRITESGVLVTRGKSAIRGLKLLLLNISKFERRIQAYLSKCSDKTNKLVMNSYEEFIDKCNLLQEEAINAIEEWQDIIPEANVKTQIGIISQLKGDMLEKESEILSLNKSLKDEKKGSEDERKKLRTELKSKEDELLNVKRELREKENYLDSSVLSGISSSAAPKLSSFALGSATPYTPRELRLGMISCSKCRHIFEIPAEGLIVCPNCNYVTQ